MTDRASTGVNAAAGFVAAAAGLAGWAGASGFGDAPIVRTAATDQAKVDLRAIEFSC